MSNRKLALVMHRDKFEEVFPISIKKPDSNLVGLMDRTICENDTNYLQFIPYIVLIDPYKDKYFVYTRGDKGDENRLHGMCSIGLGGHVDLAPEPKQSPDDNPLERLIISEAIRELGEECGISKDVLTKYIRYIVINNYVLAVNDTPVERVHVGIPIYIYMKETDLPELEAGVITKGRWLAYEEIIELVSRKEIVIETWSKLVFSHLNPTIIFPENL